MARLPKIKLAIRRRIEWMMVLSIAQRKEKRMVIEGAAGIVGVTSLVGGLGGAAYLMAALLPGVGIAVGTIVATAGLHSWLTRRK
jgi:hypothetical protein